MRFTVVDHFPKADYPGRDEAFLVRDNWNDWRKYATTFDLVVFDGEGKRHDPGKLKVGQFGMAPPVAPVIRYSSPQLNSKFEHLGAEYFSLGQDESYYETIQLLGEQSRALLVSLRDCALDQSIFQSFRNEDVMGESLLRSVAEDSVTGKFHRLANGDAKLTPFYFEYKFAGPGVGPTSPTLDFTVTPNVEPPTNVHVVIGRNGSGKTSFLQSLARSTLNRENPEDYFGTISRRASEGGDGSWNFSSLVYVSFSVFDVFELPPKTDATIKAAQVSLRGEHGSIADKSGKQTKAGRDLFIQSLAVCRRGTRQKRWVDAIRELESDPLFEEAGFGSLAEEPENEWRATAEGLFEKLSSGHAVVLLTITKLVELVDEKTLVLIDEPEGHLHPPLLSALIRSLSNLLTKRNGVCVIATHSPVILQEVPSSCVWKFERTGLIVVPERPRIETFGENVGTLTSEVFKLEVTAAGFHKLLAQAVEDEDGDYDGVIMRFGGKLGGEARAIARGLTAIYNSKKARS